MDNIYASHHHYYSEIIIDVMMSGLSKHTLHSNRGGGGRIQIYLMIERKRDAE